MDKSKFIETFLVEAESYLTALNQGIVQLEQKPDNYELLADLFRAAHTLKGASRMMGYNQIRDLAHELEDLFSLLKEKQKSFAPEMADEIFKKLDLIKAELSKINPSTGEEISTPKESPSVTAPAPEKPIQEEKAPLIKQNVETHKPSSVIPEKEEYIPVPISRINKLLNLIGEMVINKVNSSYKATLLKKLTQQAATTEKMLFDLETLLKEQLNIPDEYFQSKGTILRASQEMEKAAQVLLQLHNIEALFGRVYKDLHRLSDDTLSEIFHLNPVIEELQNKMKEIRMLPCSSLFEGFPRLIRDIAREQNKKVELNIQGAETELDKKVLESLKAPLIHLLRNAIDHGIEAAGERKGKSETAHITLSAFQEGSKVIITISDDGKGLSLDTLREKALKKGVVNSQELEAMDEKEVLNLIFTEGFSTAPLITDVSGRGIGLSVVRKELERLKGTVIVENRPGQGMTFRLELPLTIAILQVLLIEIEGIKWALPLLGLEECIKVNLETIPTLENRMILQVHGVSVPIIPLADLLGIQKNSSSETPEKNKDVNIIIINTMNKKVGFVVNKVLGEQEVFIKNLGKHLGSVTGVSGATVLPSGEVIVILNTQDLITQSQMAHPAMQNRKKITLNKKKKKILVVEDSLTTRELEKSILESHGYAVETAIDGLDALEKLRSTLVDCIVSDIQMPRMDGFEFCQNVKSNKELKDLPFIFVTSLSKDEEKRKGIDVGAQAYILKSQFDQGNLLEIIERLL